MSIRFDLASGIVKEDIARLPEKMLEFAFEVMMTQAGLMRDLWQVGIRVDTGAARDSIRIERGGEGEGWRRVRVRGGGYIVNPKSGRLVDYMGILEAKYGAGRMAFAEVKPTIAEMIKAKVVESCNP
jgi:predicted deacylase